MTDAEKILADLRFHFSGNVAGYPTIVDEIDALIKARVDEARAQIIAEIAAAWPVIDLRTPKGEPQPPPSVNPAAQGD